MTTEILQIASFLLSCISAIATLYLALQLAMVRRIYMLESRTNRMQRTLEAVQLPPSVTKTMSEILHRYHRGDMDSFRDSELANDIYAALASLETLATGILSEVYDEDIAYARLGDSIPKFYEAIRRFIYESRSAYTSESLYVQLEQLARRWSERERYSYKMKTGAL
jgi:hypothetical protein